MHFAPTSYAGHLVHTLIFFLIFATFAGCDDKGADRIRIRRACLQTIHHGYDSHVTAHGRGPADVDSFSDFMTKLDHATSTDAPALIGETVVADEAIHRMKEVEIVVIWGARYPDDGRPLSKYLMAFEARTPGSGGYVVQADGLVKHVTAKEFAAYNELPQ